MKAAAGWRIDRAWNVSGQDDTIAFPAGRRDGNRRYQRARIRVLRARKNQFAVTYFDDHAQIHNRDPMGQMLHDGQVMADEQQ